MGQQNRIVPRARAFLRRICLLLPLLFFGSPLLAASPPAAAPAAASPTAGEPAKIHELLGLLGDPQVQEWIKAQQAAKAAEPAAAGTQAKGPDLLATRFTAIRDHFGALAAVIPQMPAEFQRARDALVAETHGRGLLVVLLAVFIGLGLGVAWLFLWVTRGLRRRSLELPMDTVPQRLIALIARLVYGVLLVAAFGLGSIGAFLIFDWPPLLREILLQYLFAFLAFCLTLVLSRFLLAPGAPGLEDVDKFRILP
ncbi:MAG TPA: hypothetical protein VLA85_01675, partial [Verrucomicrobiae bacterium]|nr:hypothetical protein [Verrucomicrobiae bacterium]